LTVATLITVAALPALWLMQRDASTPGSAGVAAAGANGGIAINAAEDATTAAPTTEAATSTTTPSVVLVTEAPTAIAPVSSTIPADRRLSGDATYKRYTGYGVSNPCLAPMAPLNKEITVRSLNTGRTITCLNVVSYAQLASPNLVIVINTDTFLQMADTRDAPTQVEISW
jgi:hypothetical protein